jgi:hypothetical protein
MLNHYVVEIKVCNSGFEDYKKVLVAAPGKAKAMVTALSNEIRGDSDTISLGESSFECSITGSLIEVVSVRLVYPQDVQTLSKYF